MRPFAENFPFFCIFLALGAGIVSAVLPSGRAARRLTLTVCAADFLLSAAVLAIVVTAPLGAWGMDATCRRLLRPAAPRQ